MLADYHIVVVKGQLWCVESDIEELPLTAYGLNRSRGSPPRRP